MAKKRKVRMRAVAQLGTAASRRKARRASAYRSAAQLHILPEERKALIAFVKSPSLGRIVEVDGHAHYYDQRQADTEDAEKHECNTAGCVGGFVFAHAVFAQNLKKLRGATNADDYLNAASEFDYDLDNAGTDGDWKAPILHELYAEGATHKLAVAKKVVNNALKTGQVDWPDEEIEDPE